MKVILFIFILLSFIFTNVSCEKKVIDSKKKSVPWATWLPIDSQHPVERLQVVFGDTLYHIPKNYLPGRYLDLYDYGYMWALITFSYPDLIPTQSWRKGRKPDDPYIVLILRGHKFDTIIQDIGNIDKDLPYPSVYADDLKTCDKPIESDTASGMYIYKCHTPSNKTYYTPIDTSIRTPIGAKVFIRCEDSHSRHKYQCAIQSRIFDDRRRLITRIYLNDTDSLIDVYQKIIKVLESLEYKATLR